MPLSVEFGEKNKRTPSQYMCTIVSLLPYDFSETKPHMLPFTFNILAADPEVGFSLFYVGEGLHFIPNPFDEKQNYRQITPPLSMARSIVEDYSNSHVALDENAGPGLFYCEGKLNAADVKKEYAKELAFYVERQKNWFRNLVAMADADFEKNHNVLAVSDLQKIACRSLKLSRNWLDFARAENISCPYCQTAVDPAAIKCANCNEVINPEAYKAMQARMGVK